MLSLCFLMFGTGICVSTCRCLHLSLMLEKAGIYTSLFMLESSDVDWIMGNHERSCSVMVSFFYLLICQAWKGWWLERPSTHHATYSRMKGREEVVPEDQSVRESSEKWQRHHAATNCFYFPLKTWKEHKAILKTMMWRQRQLEL